MCRRRRPHHTLPRKAGMVLQLLGGFAATVVIGIGAGHLLRRASERYPMTEDSIEAARRDQAIERARAELAAGVCLNREGRIVHPIARRIQ